MAPIRVGLIGLSGAPQDEYEGVAWTPNAHLPYLVTSPDYEVAALLNSSASSAKAAIEKYNLPASTKAYGDPEDLAKDANVDLVVCSTRVDRHFQPIRPSIIAGKSIFVEWPLEKNLAIAKEMAALAAKYNAKTMVGIQGSFSPVVRKLKQVIESGKIGNIVSSDVCASVGNGGRTESKNVRYFLDRKVGGNLLSIHFGHSLEFITSALGEFRSWDSSLSIRYKTKDIVFPAENNRVIIPNAPNTVPDRILFNGIVSPSLAPVTINYRGGSTFPGTPALDWRIQCENGEVRVTSSSWSLNVGRPDTKIELWDGEKVAVEEVQVEADEWDELPVQAGNIARMYEAFRKGKWVPDFGWAVKRHEVLEEMWKRYDASLIE